MRSTTLPDELRDIADQKESWVIVMTKTDRHKTRQAFLVTVPARVHVTPQLWKGQQQWPL